MIELLLTMLSLWACRCQASSALSACELVDAPFARWSHRFQLKSLPLQWKLQKPVRPRHPSYLQEETPSHRQRQIL
ncbi:hypothetical protein BS78_K332600 [Paspalum vaginatum]|uniref:Secreted protein n=1 Tax=Paspalum vaginatum TaxID=158149 RepID=A0A9W7X977_9POAL|nr:hypothetical protein BS78_K332600 [Paspalum vaginatum]